MQRNRGKQENGKDYLKKNRHTEGTFHAKICTQMFIVALFTTAPK